MRRPTSALALAVFLSLGGVCYAQTPSAPEPTFRLGVDDAPKRREEQKYPDTGGIDIVTDAPWRVVRRGPDSAIPLLLFVPDATLPDRGFIWQRNRFRGLKFKRISVYEGSEVLYHDDGGADVSNRVDLEIVDELGTPVPSRLVGGMNPCKTAPPCDVPLPGGWHRILRLPLARLSGKATVFLKTEIVAQAVYEREVPLLPFVMSRTLKVQVADQEFPTLGAGWRYFDAHVHSIAEWSLSRLLLAPRKAFGGPVQMIKESASALGLLPTLDVRDRVIITDHNAFFSDKWVVPVGPTAAALTAGAGFRHDPKRFQDAVGQREFEEMRKIFGYTFGEEVTLQTPVGEDGMNLGSHLLLFRADHRDGPWHGGLLTFQIFDVNLGKPFGGEPNPNTLDAVLRDAARVPGAFAYAAHPFADGNHWNQRGDAKYQYLEVLHSGEAAYVTPEKKFVLKGAQYWNEKPAWELRAERDGYWNVDFFDLHPFKNAPSTPRPPRDEPYFRVYESYPTFSSNPGWDRELQRGLIDWHNRIRQLLRFSMSDAPKVVFPRKIYFVGGSDAHGDFNYTTTLLATILDKGILGQYKLSRRTVTSNAFGLVRTYVDPTDKPGETPEEQALNALADGNAIVTDGPVLTFAFDADLRFDSANLAWRDELPSDGSALLDVFTVDGRIGGHGRFDGGFTALVVRGADQAAIRYRWNNSSEFGPPFGGTPHTVDLYVDRPGPPVGRVTELVPLRMPPPERSQQNRERLFVLDPAKHTAFDVPLALSMAALSTKNEQEEDEEKFRVYTNPIWIVPVDVAVDQRVRDSSGALDVSVTFTFGMSMTPTPYRVVLQALDDDGRNTGPASLLVPDTQAGPNGWRPDRDGTVSAEYRVATTQEVRPAAGSRGRFIVYLEQPQDAHGNKLNSIAKRIVLGP
jgi:hypothetical protein